MTIGIAACGPGAADAILSALMAVETFASGAIAGFVSLAAIVEDRIERVEIQTGGATALIAAGSPQWLADSRCAVLMSSGPNRPPPLAQFTPGDAAIGLVTGHRFPNAHDRDGHPLNRTALALMGRGLEPQAAVDAVATANPEADAGLLAISADGRIGLKDCAYLDQFADRSHATLSSPAGIVAVTHNGIVPYRGLASIVADLALERMSPPPTELRRIEVRAGIHLRIGPRNAVEVDDNGCATGLLISNPLLMRGTNSFGLGYRAEVVGAPGQRLQYEPFMVAQDGVLLSIDGTTGAWLAIG
jgi:hypothetical protein